MADKLNTKQLVSITSYKSSPKTPTVKRGRTNGATSSENVSPLMGYSTPVSQRNKKIITFFEESPTQDVEICSQYACSPSSHHQQDNFPLDVTWRWGSPKTEAEELELRRQRILKQKSTNRLLRESQLANKKNKVPSTIRTSSTQNQPKTGFFRFQDELRQFNLKCLGQNKENSDDDDDDDNKSKLKDEDSEENKNNLELNNIEITSNCNTDSGVATALTDNLKELLDDSDFDQMVNHHCINDLIRQVEKSLPEEDDEDDKSKLKNDDSEVNKNDLELKIVEIPSNCNPDSGVATALNDNLKGLLDDSDFDQMISHQCINDLIRRVENDDLNSVDDKESPPLVKKKPTQTKPNVDDSFDDEYLSCIPLAEIMQQASSNRDRSATNFLSATSGSFTRHQSFPHETSSWSNSRHIAYAATLSSKDGKRAQEIGSRGLCKSSSPSTNVIKRNFSSDAIWSTSTSQNTTSSNASSNLNVFKCSPEEIEAKRRQAKEKLLAKRLQQPNQYKK